MNVNIVCVGKIKEKFIKDGIDEYAKRLSRFCKFQIIEVGEELCSDTNSKNVQLTKIAEGKRIISKLKGYSIALDLKGDNISSEGLSKKLSYLKQNGSATLTFVIGGSFGLSQEVLEHCDCSICFGAITFPHQLIRLVLCEQIYRAFMIEEGAAYHK